MCGEKKAKMGYLAAERTTDPIGSFSDLAIEKREVAGNKLATIVNVSLTI